MRPKKKNSRRVYLYKITLKDREVSDMRKKWYELRPVFFQNATYYIVIHNIFEYIILLI